MQKQTSAMNVMGLSSGYADCLRRLRRACEAGEQMDCSCLGEGTKLLLAQSEATLEAQLSFYAEMHASLCCLGVEKARGNGKKAGRPRQAVPEIFAEVLADWNKGLVSNKQAAALCGISQKVFLGRAFEENRKICEADQVLRRKICEDWLVGRLGIAEVVKRLGIARAQFLACVKEDAFQRDYLPPVILEAYELWKTRKMTKFEAARHCKMGMTTFNDCLRKMGKSTISLGSSHDAELLYARAIRLYQQGVVTQSAAARLCETSSVVFFRRLQADGANNVVFEDFMPAPHAFPKGFCTAYRSYVRGQMRAQEAAESCSMTYDAFLEWVRKVEHGEDLEKAQALFDQKVLQWQNGEISKMQLLRDIRMNSARFNHYCEQKQIVKFKKTKAQKA